VVVRIVEMLGPAEELAIVEALRTVETLGIDET